MAKSKNKTLLDIITGISQVASKLYDGALDEEGKPIEIGLNREVDNIITDSRMIDGVGIRIQGEFLIVSYHAQILMQDIHSKKFEKDIEEIFNQVIKFIKKQYKLYTKETLGLKDQGKAKMKVESASRIRSWIIAQKIYHITKAEVEEVGDDKKLEKAIKNWLELRSNSKPKNVKINKNDNQKEEK